MELFITAVVSFVGGGLVSMLVCMFSYHAWRALMHDVRTTAREEITKANETADL
jgi:hypothetical protein